MTLPNKLTLLRIFLTPVFFGLAYYTYLVPLLPRVELNITLLVLFALLEITDLLDGYLARRLNQISDLGKLLDPFSDVFLRITYFFLFVQVGIMPVIFFVIILWREFLISFLRMVMLRMDIVMAARWSGKFKAVTYFLSGVYGMLALAKICPLIDWIANTLFLLSALFAILSLSDYILFILKEVKKKKSAPSEEVL